MTETIIREFRINSTYKGYYLIIDAVEFFVANERRCIKITKDIYPYLSKKYQMPISCVERNIRTVIELCWNNNSTKVNDIIGYDSMVKPSNGIFIEALAVRCIKQKI